MALQKTVLFQNLLLTMVKIFLANLPDEGFVMNGDERYFLEAYGTVKECEIIKSMGWSCT